MELKIDDLIGPCARCGGTDNEPPTEKPPQRGSSGSIGRQVIETSSFQSKCASCQGTGRGKLTPAGEVLLEFITVLQKKQQI